MKNILILNGSPRKQGNTEMISKAFREGAEANGHTVVEFDTTAKRINGCIACDTCWSKGTACSFTDGFSELEPLLENADVIVLATPLYWFSMTAQIKAAIDKLYAYVRESCIRPLKINESILLTCGGEKDLDCYEGLVQSYKSIAKYMQWEDKGILIAPDVYEKGDILNTLSLEDAKKLGMTL